MLGNVKIKLYHVSERLTWLSDISLFKFNKNKSYIKWKSLGRINDLPEPSRGLTSIHYTFLAFRLLILEWLIKDSSEKKDFFKRLFLVLLFFINITVVKKFSLFIAALVLTLPTNYVRVYFNTAKLDPWNFLTDLMPHNLIYLPLENHTTFCSSIIYREKVIQIKKYNGLTF